MGISDLIEAVEKYAEARRESKYAGATENAKSALMSALDKYVDERLDYYLAFKSRKLDEYIDGRITSYLMKKELENRLNELSELQKKITEKTESLNPPLKPPGSSST